MFIKCLICLHAPETGEPLIFTPAHRFQYGSGHSVLLATTSSSDGVEVHEAIFGTPHGIRLDGEHLRAFLEAKPEVTNLMLMHGLKEGFTAGITTVYGAKGGLALYRKIGGAKYWLTTHNAELSFGAVILRLLGTHDISRTLAWVLKAEGNDDKQRSDKDPNLVEAENGGCLVLA